MFSRFLCLLGCFIFLFSSVFPGNPVKSNDQNTDSSLAAPDLVALFSLAEELSVGYEDLKRKLEDVKQLKVDKAHLLDIQNQLYDLSNQFRILKDNESSTYGQLADIRSAIKNLRLRLKEYMEPVNELLSEVIAMEKNWSDKQKKWASWNKSLEDESLSGSVIDLITRSHDVTSEALATISNQLELIIENKLLEAELDAKSYSLLSDVEKAIAKKRTLFTFGETPIMFSKAYLSQFNAVNWNSAFKDIKELLQHNTQFFINEWHLIALQVLLALMICGLVKYFRSSTPSPVEEGQFQNYPYSIGLIVAIALLSMFYSLYSPLWFLIISVVGLTAIGRLVSSFTASKRKRMFLYWLITTMIFLTVASIVRPQVPLYQIILLVLTVSGGGICCYYAKEEKREGGSLFLIASLYSFAALLLTTSCLTVLGFSDFAGIVFTPIVRVASTFLVAILLLLLGKRGVHWLIYESPLKDCSLFGEYGSQILAKSVSVLYVLITFLGSLALLTILVYDTPYEAIDQISSLGITLGESKITLGAIFTVGIILYSSFIISWITQTILRQNIFRVVNVPDDVGASMSRLIHYVIIVIGFLTSLLVLGFSLTNITIIAGSLGIGVGLGLQEIVKNFAAGVLVLFERPIRVGDVIEFEGGPCSVKKIGLRATIIKTKNETEIVIPNNDLITNPLTNWTLTQRRYRLIFPIGVAYNSDVTQVMQILKDSAEAEGRVLKTPPPQVIFMDFGDSSLNFELRVWIHDIKNRRPVQTAINQDLEKRFRLAGINIPYNQLDVHIQTNSP